TVHELLEHMGTEVGGVDVLQGTLLGAHGGTDRADDVSLGHDASKFLCVGVPPRSKPSGIRSSIRGYMPPSAASRAHPGESTADTSPQLSRYPGNTKRPGRRNALTPAPPPTRSPPDRC